jgi:dolichol-phosphate mannosyltransferase
MVHRAALAGGVVTEVPIRFIDRVEGRSKMSMRTIVEALALVTWWGMSRLVGRRPVSRAPEVEAGQPAP